MTTRQLVLAVMVGLMALLGPQEEKADDRARPQEAITSRVLRTAAGESVLIEEILVAAPVAEVWRAFTTSEGYVKWAAPVAEVDLRIGGTIRTRYDRMGKIGDAGTITLKVLNYVPERLLTMQAEPQTDWPELLKRDADHLMNVVVFDALEGGRTRISSYGLGYRDGKAYESMLQFFRQANRGLYAKLKEVLENPAAAEEPTPK